MKHLLGYLVLLCISIFAILFIIVYIEIYYIEPHTWIYSQSILIQLVVSISFGSVGFLMILFSRTKYYLNTNKKVCKQCGNRNRMSALYCDKCGTEL